MHTSHGKMEGGAGPTLGDKGSRKVGVAIVSCQSCTPPGYVVNGHLNPEQTETRSVASKGWGGGRRRGVRGQEQHELRGYHVVLISTTFFFWASRNITKSTKVHWRDIPFHIRRLIVALKAKYCGVLESTHWAPCQAQHFRVLRF